MAEILERVQQTSQGGRRLKRRAKRTAIFSSVDFRNRRRRRAVCKHTEGVGETSSLADALCRHRNRGATARLQVAHRPLTRTGPYDAIFDNYGRRSRSGIRLELLLPALSLLRRFRCRFLSTFRHCCPPGHVTWQMHISTVGDRHALHSVYTSAIKKTVTRPDGVCKRRKLVTQRRDSERQTQRDDDLHERVPPRSRDNADITKHTMK
jgi:hypothetical protein